MQDPSSSGPASDRCDEHAPGNWRDTHPVTQHQNKKRNGTRDSDDRLRDLPEWLEDYTDNLDDTEVLVPAHVAQNADSERPTRVASNSRRHSVFNSLPKRDRNCEVRLRTKITRAPCRRRSGEAVPQAEKLGDLITADHKVLNVEGESRNNHQYAVVVQDLANQGFNVTRAKQTSQETEKSLGKFLEPSQRPKVMCTENSLEFGKSCEEVSWNHRTRSETNGFAERAVRRVTERTSAVLLQSGLDEQMVG